MSLFNSPYGQSGAAMSEAERQRRLAEGGMSWNGATDPARNLVGQVPAAGQGGNSMAPRIQDPGNPNASLPRPGTGGAAPGAPAAGGNGRIDPTTAQNAQNAATYDPSNPIRALTNALAAQGINSGSSNPVMRYIMSMAPGLSTSFLTRGAAGGFGANAEEVQQNGGIGAYFGDFLKNAIAGQGPGGMGLSQTLMNPLGPGQGGSLEALRAASMATRNMNADTSGTANFNPFTAQLRSMIGSDPAGGAGMIASLLTPSLGSYGRAFGDEMGRRADTAYSRINYQDPNNSDIFSYLLGLPQGQQSLPGVG